MDFKGPEWHNMTKAETGLEEHSEWNKDNRNFEYDCQCVEWV